MEGSGIVRTKEMRVAEALRYMEQGCGVTMRPKLRTTSDGEQSLTALIIDWIDLGDPKPVEPEADTPTKE